jgi:hypothetical protein
MRRRFAFNSVSKSKSFQTAKMPKSISSTPAHHLKDGNACGSAKHLALPAYRVYKPHTRWSLERLTAARYDDVNMASDGSIISMSINNELLAQLYQWNTFQPKVDSNPIAPRVRRKRQRLPPSLLIENASDRVPLRCQSSCPRRFRSSLATTRTCCLPLWAEGRSAPILSVCPRQRFPLSSAHYRALMLGDCVGLERRPR